MLYLFLFKAIVKAMSTHISSRAVAEAGCAVIAALSKKWVNYTVYMLL